MSYESPIKLTNTMESIVRRVREEEDKKIYECIANYGIDVNKEELEKALRYDRDQYVKGYKDGKAEAMQWITVSERLPEDTKTKIITLSDGSVEGGYYSEEQWWCVGDSINLEVVKTENVIAWRPLPPAYKEGESS